ncbi:unnamed protein product, partial [Prorocentrum cordatum]
MPKTARTGGLAGVRVAPVSFKQWRRSICDEWFASSAAFEEHVLRRPILFPDGLEDALSLRAIAIFLHYGVAARPSGCAECGGSTKFEARADREWNTYRWSCKTVGHKHFCEPVNSHGFLTKVPVNSWMPFLYLINNLRLGRNLEDVQDEMADLFGNIHRGTISVWKQLYQECLGKALPALDALMVGGKKGDTVVVDETVIGVDKADGWVLEPRSATKGGATTARTGPRRTTKLARKQILKRLPARTVYNTQQVQKGSFKLKSKPMKGPMMRPMKNVAIRKRPAANLKSNGRWLWIAVLVGNKSDVYTHLDPRKRVTHKLLPRKADAHNGEPRGLEEIKEALVSRVRKKSMVVPDGLASTRSALGKLGSESPPAVVHEGNQCRDKKTGFHTDDVESENARAKGWSRKRYGHLHLSEAEMDEYVFYVNAGGATASVTRGLAASNGFVAGNALERPPAEPGLPRNHGRPRRRCPNFAMAESAGLLPADPDAEADAGAAREPPRSAAGWRRLGALALCIGALAAGLAEAG